MRRRSDTLGHDANLLAPCLPAGSSPWRTDVVDALPLGASVGHDTDEVLTAADTFLHPLGEDREVIRRQSRQTADVVQ